MFKLLSKYCDLEVAVAVNGRVWIKASNIKSTIILANILKSMQYMSLEEAEAIMDRKKE